MEIVILYVVVNLLKLIWKPKYIFLIFRADANSRVGYLKQDIIAFFNFIISPNRLIKIFVFRGQEDGAAIGHGFGSI